jgi:starch synthase
MAKKPTGSQPTGSKKEAAEHPRGSARTTSTTPEPTRPAMSRGAAPAAETELLRPAQDPAAADSIVEAEVTAIEGTTASLSAAVSSKPKTPSAATPRTGVDTTAKEIEPQPAREHPATGSVPEQKAEPPRTPTPAPASAGSPNGSVALSPPESEPPRQPQTAPEAEPAAPHLEPEPDHQPQPAPEPEETPRPEPPPEPEPEETPQTEPEHSGAPEPEPYHAPARPSLFIVHITPELAAVAKVGGLADVVFGLSRELAIRGNHVEIILPKYATLRHDQIFDMHEVYKDLWVPWYDGAIHCTVFFGFVHGRKCFFIEPHSPEGYFNRDSIYGYRDDVLRYAFFSRAAMEFLWQSGKHPDVIHVHDWQTALVPVFLYEIYQRLGMTHPRVCLTIHNFAHQGVTGVEILHATGLHRPERFFDRSCMGDNTHPKALNLLKAGIVFSNFITTVSPRYASETRDQGQGFGLEPTLHTHQAKYGGVVNGIDYHVWNPEIDHHIPVRYGVESIDGKYDNKRALRHRLMLADNEKPIVAFIGRLDPQKGLELVRHAIFYTLERGAQFVLLGSSPDDRINADFRGLKQMLNDSPDCHLEIGFDEDLSHLIYAGADMMLVPSRFEPCGLTQLIALRYGTVPIVREVGGLADTVFDKDHSYRPLHERNGYVFRDFDNAGLESALGRAIACYRDHPEHFRELMKNAMRSDYSWNTPGQDYLNIYDYIREG